MKTILSGIFHFLSVAFHPFLIIMYMLFLYLIVNPYLFPYSGGKEFGAIILIILFTSVVIPGVSVLLMLGTGFIDSLRMHKRTERIGPLIAVSICYLWLYLNIRTHNAIPIDFSAFVLGALISVFISFFVNNFSKISLHAVGVGGFLAGSLFLIIEHGKNYVLIGNILIHNILLICVIVIISGMVLSSRLYLGSHNFQDVAGGFLVGLIGQMIAIRFF